MFLVVILVGVLQGSPQPAVGFPEPVGSGEGLDCQHYVRAGEPQSRGKGNLGNYLIFDSVQGFPQKTC